jgi:putative addiction module killer protein
MLPSLVFEIAYYTRDVGDAPFETWFNDLDRIAKAKITIAIARLEQGNVSNVKNLGDGVMEYKVAFGPGYRLYFGIDRKTIVILLTGGTKQRQSRDIANAKILWREYKMRKVKH